MYIKFLAFSRDLDRIISAMFIVITHHPITSKESAFILEIQWKIGINTHLYLSMYCDNWE